MTRPEPWEHVANQGRVMGALILAEPYLSAQIISSLQEFIEHNEYGLALELIVDHLIERAAPVPKTLVDEINSMSHMMYPGEDAQERLCALSRLASADQDTP